MANAALFRSLVGALIPWADARIEERAPAHRLPPRQALAQYAATGCLNATFYATAAQQLDRVLELSPTLMDRVFDRIVDSPRMLRTFVQIVRSGATGRKSPGSAPKRCVRRWLDQRTDAALFAASVGNAPSLADVVRMVHPKPRTRTREALWLSDRARRGARVAARARAAVRVVQGRRPRGGAGRAVADAHGARPEPSRVGRGGEPGRVADAAREPEHVRAPWSVRGSAADGARGGAMRERSHARACFRISCSPRIVRPIAQYRQPCARRSRTPWSSRLQNRSRTRFVRSSPV